MNKQIFEFKGNLTVYGDIDSAKFGKAYEQALYKMLEKLTLDENIKLDLQNASLATL